MTAEELEDYPEQYRTNTRHEKAALDLAENYRLQYENLFPSRSPLFIAPKNEAGNEKVVSTFVQVFCFRMVLFNLLKKLLQLAHIIAIQRFLSLGQNGRFHKKLFVDKMLSVVFKLQLAVTFWRILFYESVI